MTLTRLAALANTSVSTVSKAFSGSREISDEMREHIFKIAKENGCYDKFNKHKYEKRVVAVICPEIKGYYYPSFVSAFVSEIEKYGAIATVSATGFNPKSTLELYNYYTCYAKVDGIILINAPLSAEASNLVPTISLDSTRRDNMTFNIHLSDAILDALTHLKELGHTRIGFAGEEKTVFKFEKFKSAMRKLGIPLESEYIKISSKRFESAGEDVADMFLSSEDRPTAIIASYDNIAIGLIRKLKSCGYRVPEDFSVIGMDDITIDPYLETSLSSIGVDTDEVVKKTTKRLMRCIDQKIINDDEPLVICARYVPRESTAPPNE